MIPVATRAYRVRVAVATVQFSRAAERAAGAGRGTLSSAARARVHPAGRRSLKTQQHAPARDRRSADQAGPGSVDVLGRTVGDRPIPPLAPRGNEAP